MNGGEGSRCDIIRNTVPTSAYKGAENYEKLVRSCRCPIQNSNQVLSQGNSETLPLESVWSITGEDFDNYDEYYYYDYEWKWVHVSLKYDTISWMAVILKSSTLLSSAVRTSEAGCLRWPLLFLVHCSYWGISKILQYFLWFCCPETAWTS
jgi:hypothetical protein